VRPDAVYQPDGRPRGERSLVSYAVLIVIALIGIGVAAWVVAGAVHALLHIIELLVVAGAAGWVGYRLGIYRGRRHPHP
jgi:hypothetical protein